MVVIVIVDTLAALTSKKVPLWKTIVENPINVIDDIELKLTELASTVSRGVPPKAPELLY